MKNFNKLLLSMCLAIVCAFSCVGLTGCEKEKEKPQEPAPQEQETAQVAFVSDEVRVVQLVMQAISKLGTVNYKSVTKTMQTIEGGYTNYYNAECTLIYDDKGIATSYIQFKSPNEVQIYEAWVNVPIRLDEDYVEYYDMYKYGEDDSYAGEHGQVLNITNVQYLLTYQIPYFVMNTSNLKLTTEENITKIHIGSIVGDDFEIWVEINKDGFATSISGIFYYDNYYPMYISETYEYTNVEFEKDVPTDTGDYLLPL